MISRRILRVLDRIDTDRRRIWAARMLVFSLVGWAISHVLIVATGRSAFYEHCLMAISWCAISITAIDVVITSDVRDQQSDGSL